MYSSNFSGVVTVPGVVRVGVMARLVMASSGRLVRIGLPISTGTRTTTQEPSGSSSAS